MKIDETRRENLAAYIREHYQGNRAAFCRATGKNPNLINLILTDNPDYRRGFGERLARDIEKRSQLSVGWLDKPKGQGVKRAATVAILSSESEVGDAAPERFDFSITLPTDDVRFHSVTAINNVVACAVRDPQIAPDAERGTIAYIDLGIKQIRGDGIYVIRRHGLTELMRVQVMGGSTIKFSKDVPIYEPIVGDRDVVLAGVEVLGKVFYLARGMHV